MLTLAILASSSAPLPESLRPVRPGMEGGRYKPLSDADVLKIHNAALDALETIGFADAPESGIELMTRAGAKLTDTGRLLFPRALVEDTIANAARHFVLHAQDPKYDMEPWGSRVYFGTAGAAVHMVDAQSGEYRDSTTRDLYDIARVVAPEARQEVIGIRPGEKLHEQMIGPEDSAHTYEYPEHFKILPAIHNWSASPGRIKDGVKVAEGFTYASDSNPDWMSESQLQAWIEANRDKIGAI